MPLTSPGVGTGQHRQVYLKVDFLYSEYLDMWHHAHLMDAMAGTHLVPPAYALPPDGTNPAYAPEVRGWLEEYEQKYGPRGTSSMTTEQVPLDWTCGPLRVIDVRSLVGSTRSRHWPASPEITPARIQAAEKSTAICRPGDIVLFRTGHLDKHLQPAAARRRRVDRSLAGQERGLAGTGPRRDRYLKSKGIRCVATDAPDLGGVDPKRALMTYWALGSREMVGVEFLHNVGERSGRRGRVLSVRSTRRFATATAAQGERSSCTEATNERSRITTEQRHPPLGQRRSSRAQAAALAKLGQLHWAGDRDDGHPDRRRRMAAGAHGDGQVRRRADVAGFGRDRVPGVLQPGVWPLRLYCGEPVFTGFMRCRPGPMFWVGLMLVLNSAALIPGLSTHGAAMIAAIVLDRPPTVEDSWLITPLAYACLLGVTLPVLLGGKVYNMLQGVMTAKVVTVLGFCLIVGVSFVGTDSWWKVFSGFVKFGNVPVSDGQGGEVVTNAFVHRWETGEWPLVSTTSIVVLGAFAGYAGGGGLANSTYSNFVRDKGWGMGSQVGAIPSAIGGRKVKLSHVGKVFPLTHDNLRRWRHWWHYVLSDQLIVWAPGCFVGMALPALLVDGICQALHHHREQSGVAQAVITADGLRNAGFSPLAGKVFWIAALFTGLMVMLPSQMSIVDDFSRRWTDAIWSASRWVRRMEAHQVKYIYYAILSTYVLWSLIVRVFFQQRPATDDRLYRQLQQPGAGRHGLSTVVDQSPAAAQGAAAPVVSFSRAHRLRRVLPRAGDAGAHLQDSADADRIGAEAGRRGRYETI